MEIYHRCHSHAIRDTQRNLIPLVIPSECYENNPRSVIEAFALGKPVVGARIGGIPELNPEQHYSRLMAIYRQSMGG